MTEAALTFVDNGAIASALRTISTESRALEAIGQALNTSLAGSFAKAVELILRLTGRVIVTGVGKSGHIGAKIAATLASTGTPAFFVHAAESSHGDLGMIGSGDIVIALSKSSAELRNIINCSRRFSLPLIAMTFSQQSTLSSAADVTLLLPTVEEACPHRLAPTTSAIVQLALGDALAIALLEARNFSAQDFKVFHPGGKLGASFTRVEDVMHVGRRVPLVFAGTPLPEAVTVLSQKHFGCIAILSRDRRLRGIVTQGDIAKKIKSGLSDLLVDDIMTREPKTIRPREFVENALPVMEQYKIGALIVVDEENHLLGLIHFHDLLRLGVA
ncbi:KpsF/GutQ family sugar-phosphate isomerase [Rhizobium sp. CC1099]|uniref:KpsF/GutQ family sugar-phosphate isomerase n=1 Tax=Rhizobium sp. CC1099 TaxID=3039160 RepID=UPI0024B25480|nr:KpsF/GutQ family sugar-phosphate isomerase [Rhizobium sp. CC1099]WFU86326.1 KpsF/GutQ family sugar-phosphate isomerase [Rhizobium sp. CC1099]